MDPKHAKLNRDAKPGEYTYAQIGGCGGNAFGIMTVNGEINADGISVERAEKAIRQIEENNAMLTGS